ncbi:MAG: hypothetical protein IID46_14610 [Planctomycetes bacterium]|nr:hypothetical protein [Planctomycetota bacterium]
MRLFAQSAQTEEMRTAEVSLVDVDNKTYSGVLRAITKNQLVIDQQGETHFDLSGLFKLQFKKRESTLFRPGSLLLLDNGDQLVIGLSKMTENNLFTEWAKWPDGPVIEIPLETIRGILFHVPRNAAARIKIIRNLINAQKKNDVLILTNGNRVSGELLNIDFTELKWEGPVGKTVIPLTRVRAIGFNSELISFPKSEGQKFLLTLTDGSQITAKRIEMLPNFPLRVQAEFATRLIIPASRLVSLRFLGGRVHYLSDLKPVEYEFTPYLSTQWPLQHDRNTLPRRTYRHHFAHFCRRPQRTDFYAQSRHQRVPALGHQWRWRPYRRQHRIGRLDRATC